MSRRKQREGEIRERQREKRVCERESNCVSTIVLLHLSTDISEISRLSSEQTKRLRYELPGHFPRADGDAAEVSTSGLSPDKDRVGMKVAQTNFRLASEVSRKANVTLRRSKQAVLNFNLLPSEKQILMPAEVAAASLTTRKWVCGWVWAWQGSGGMAQGSPAAEPSNQATQRA